MTSPTHHVLTLLHYPLLLCVHSVRGIENLPEPPYIIAANHPSILDPLVLHLILHRHGGYHPRFLVAEHLYFPPFSWYFSFFGSVRVTKRDPARTLEQAHTVLENGGTIGIFPEGRLSPYGTRSLKTGVARLASSSRAPVVPVRITRVGLGRVSLEFKPPLTYEGDDTRTGWDRFCSTIADEILTSSARPEQRPRPPAPEQGDRKTRG